MQQYGSLGRSVILALSLLSACAAADPTGAGGGEADSGAPDAGRGRFSAPGSAAAFLTDRFAIAEGDMGYGADQLLKAMKIEPNDPDIRRQAFLSAVLANRPEAADLARAEADNPAAMLLLGNIEAARGNWAAA